MSKRPIPTEAARENTPKPKGNLLLVDDDPDFRSMTARNLRRRGYTAHEAEHGMAGLQLLDKYDFEVVILDVSMPGLTGIEVLEKLKQSDCDTEVIMLTGETAIKTAVDAMKLGALDYLSKPVGMDELVAVVEKARDSIRLRRENRRLKQFIARANPTHHMLGHSASIREVFRLIERAGPTDKPILIQGESGTGKELVARALHQASPVCDQPLVVVNCAALSENLLESELFGHEKGAFTGAVAAKEGLFEIADGGTLFIDEIGEMATSLQAKLLRVLEDGSMRRVGSVKERTVNVRIISATNRDMQAEVAAGRFREDLFYRIDVMTLTVPPLRQRTGDLPLLIHHFAGDEWEVADDAMTALCEYSWPGNVRQLINAIERAKILADEEVIQLKNLPSFIAELSDRADATVDASASSSVEATTQVSLSDLDSIQAEHIQSVLNQFAGNKARTARTLGISRRTLYRLLEKYEIEEES